MSYLEGEELDISLDSGVRPIPADEPLDVEHGVLGVGGQLVLGCVTNQTLAVGGEGDVTGRDTVTLVVGDNFHTAVLEYAHAASKRESQTMLGGERQGEKIINSVTFFFYRIILS